MQVCVFVCVCTHMCNMKSGLVTVDLFSTGLSRKINTQKNKGAKNGSSE